MELYIQEELIRRWVRTAQEVWSIAVLAEVGTRQAGSLLGVGEQGMEWLRTARRTRQGLMTGPVQLDDEVQGLVQPGRGLQQCGTQEQR